MKIYTRGGDQGNTGIIGGERLRKDHLIIEACGSMDELNAALGVAISQIDKGPRLEALASIQADLFSLGAILASPPDKAPTVSFDEERIADLEASIDEMEKGLPPLKNFILPGGSPSGAALHHARAVCRRAERRLCSLLDGQAHFLQAIQYLNRLSDFLFVMARTENAATGAHESTWNPKG